MRTRERTNVIMIKTIGVQLDAQLKVYDFKAKAKKVKLGDKVIVEAGEGILLGRVVYVDKKVSEKELESPLGEIKRMATEADLKKEARLREKAKDILPIFEDKIKKFNLPMRAITASITLDEEKVILYFISENRVDFRELAKDLIRTLKKQVRLHQIGPRDAARILDGFGVCGRPLCCNLFLTNLESITMDMAREQNIAFKGSEKISGTCGRLMCCLAFENDFLKEKPKEESQKAVKKEKSSHFTEQEKTSKRIKESKKEKKK